jgi:hypothetical protein
VLKETLHGSDCSELSTKPYCSVTDGEFVDQQSDYYFTMRNLLARLEVSTAVLLNILVPLDVNLCARFKVSGRSDGTRFISYDWSISFG